MASTKIQRATILIIKKAVRKNNSYDCLRKDETIIYSKLEPFLFIFPKRFQHYKDITPFPYCL